MLMEAHRANLEGMSLGRHRGHEIEGLWDHGIDGYAKARYVNQNAPVAAQAP